MLQDPSLPCEIVPALAWAFQESNESIAYESSGYSSPFTQSSQSCHGLSASPKRCLRVFARRERLRRTGGRRDPKAHEALSNRVLAEHHDLLFAKLQFPADRAEPKSNRKPMSVYQGSRHWSIMRVGVGLAILTVLG
jgi:hypothetical protein